MLLEPRLFLPEGHTMNAPFNHHPDDEVLQELAAGISAPALAEQTMQHVSRCSECSIVLRKYLQEFSDEPSAENQAIIGQLQSSKPQWQKRLVRGQISGGRRFFWLKPVSVAGMLAVIIFAVVQGPALLTSFKVSKAKKLVATAFADRRTTALKLPAVEHSEYRPFPVELGAESGRGLDEVPESLHDASGAANQNLTASKSDPRWLQVQGLVSLWEATPSSLEKAEKDFEKARSQGLATPSLEIDLAASYFERDSRSDHPNLQRSLNLLNEVLTRPELSNDDRSSALFNLAIAYEKTQAWDLAVATWEKYLQVDSTSGWANEAKQHLQDAKAKIQRTAFSPLQQDLLTQATSDTVKKNVEQYQDLAIVEWLPATLRTQDGSSLNAIRNLGDTLAKGHSDPWLADLTSALGWDDAPAVEALADAVKKNSLGDHSTAIKQSQVAAKLFLQRKNPAGELRAQLEGIEAYRRMFNGAECVAHVDLLLNRLSTTSYHWMHAWALLEKAECGNLLGGFGQADADLHASRQIASKFDFPVLVLRDLSLSAGNKHLRGNCDESWKESVDGLNVYWQKPGVPQSRLFQFYTVMLQCALEKGFLHEGEALLRQAILVLETSSNGDSKNQKIDGTLHLQLANVLFARQANKEAEEEMRKAAALVDPQKLPPQFDLIIKFEPAEFQLEHGNPKLALTALEPLRATLAHKPDKFFSLRFNQTLGRAYYKAGQLDQARSAYEAAIETAESSLGAIHDGRERLLWLRAIDESYRGLVRVLIDQKKSNEALDRWELYKSRPMLQEQFNGIAAAVNTESGNPQPDSQAFIYNSSEPRIIYASFDDGLCIWIVQAGNVTSQWIDLGQKDFENMSHEFVEKCADENSKLSDLNQLGTRLFAALLQPVISDIPAGKPVTIEQDQLAYNLPMEALQSPDGWYFGEKYSVVYSAGIRVEKTLRLPQPVSMAETFVLLDASRVKGAGYLPGFDRQAATITRLFPRTTVVDTTKTSLTKSQLLIASSEIFHYMGHGKPSGSGTGLDYDGKQQLQAKDFNAGSLKRSQIAVLAACSGAVGKENGLEDTNNLVRAFLAGGVPSIVASHWNVDSTSTSQLMTSFYRHLANHESVAQAMYNARIEILHAKAHPYFWAGFALTGRAS